MHDWVIKMSEILSERMRECLSKEVSKGVSD